MGKGGKPKTARRQLRGSRPMDRRNRNQATQNATPELTMSGPCEEHEEGDHTQRRTEDQDERFEVKEMNEKTGGSFCYLLHSVPLPL